MSTPASPARGTPAIRISETELNISHPLPAFRTAGLTAIADAIEEWLTFHGIDPDNVIICDEPVERLPDACQIRYPSIRHGIRFTAIEQGEAPPLPWPESITAR